MSDQTGASEFRDLLERSFPDLNPVVAGQLDQYRTLVLAENSRQNLTRITAPADFVDGHIADCVFLGRFLGDVGLLMDLGSGVGVPGIPTALIFGGRWVLSESEGRKAAFLEAAIQQLGLSGVRVFSGRAEEYLRNNQVDAIVVRAVGSVLKLFRVLDRCSTWNRLVLLKGPRFDEEWTELASEVPNCRWQISRKLPYSVGDKSRILVEVVRK